MRIGVPREIKIMENRVACTPGGARSLAAAGHGVLVQTGAGAGCGYEDDEYRKAGATIVPSAADAWAADLVFKVKEPMPEEHKFLRPGLLLFTYLHLAAARRLTDVLLQSRTIGVAYETIQVDHRLPLLEPMSEIAGRMSPMVGSFLLSKAQGGKGVLLGGVPGVLPGKVLVIGGGTAGVNAARVACGLGAEVTVLDIDVERMRYLDMVLHSSIRTLYSSPHNLMEQLPDTDLLVAAALVPGARAPVLVTREMLGRMTPGSVIVDIAIDQGGCLETSRPTTHSDPVYTEEGVLHYCVTNMPGAYARTATQALTNVTLPYALTLAGKGFEGALRSVPELRLGVNTWNGQITCRPVAKTHGLEFTQLDI